MTSCPNCGQKITNKTKICPHCGFNLERYQKDFFTDRHRPAKLENQDAIQEMARRQTYHREFFPQKQNTTVQKMIAWIRSNATIVFLLGIFLLIVMSFSRSLGWICFMVLLLWLLIVCDRADKITQYTADKRLTQKINQLGSNVFNSVADHRAKIRKHGANFEAHHPYVENKMVRVKERKHHHFGYLQISVLLTAFISLLVIFSGSGASIVDALYMQKMSISKVLLNLAARFISSGQTMLYAMWLYLLWLLLILFPILIIYNILHNTKASQVIAFVLSLIETLFLFYLIFHLSSPTRAGTGVFSRLTSQLITYAVSIGTSTYFLILASVMTTCLSGYNVYKYFQRFDH